MLAAPEARYHRLDGLSREIAGKTFHTVAGEVLCSYGSCGHVLAEVTLSPFDHAWSVDVSRHYSHQPDGRWRWRAHSPRTYRPRMVAPFAAKVTTRGDLILTGPSGTQVRYAAAGHVANRKQIALLRPGESIMIECRQKGAHLSRISYEGLMREITIEARLIPAD
jgi:hypothetical protein